MSDEHRRWDDVIREIDLRLDVRVPPAVQQGLVPYRLTVEETARDVAQLKIVVFGNPAIGVRGLVDRFRTFEEKLDTILEQSKERQVMLRGLTRTAEVTRWIVVFLGSVAGLIIALNALGVIHL